MAGWLTAEEAASLLGYNTEYVRRLIRNSRLRARKFGYIWLVYPDSVGKLKAILERQIREGYSKYDPRRGSTS